MSLSTLEPQILDLITRNAVTLPPYPAVAMKLRKAVSGGKAGTPELARIVGEDQMLAAAVLRAANSALNRGVKTFTALPDAISRIGSEELCRIAVANSVGQAAGADGSLSDLRRSVWRQGVASALCCDLIAGFRRANSTEAFACGLLHDFGKIVTICCIEQLLAKKKDLGARSEAEWAEVVERFHVDLGLLTAARWNLSDLLCAVISTHHQPERAGIYRSTVDIINLADALVALMEEKAVITADDLRGIPQIGGHPEIEFLLGMLPEIPSAISALENAAPPPVATIPSQVSKPTTALKGTRKSVAMAASLVKQAGETPFQVHYLTPDGLSLAGAVPLRTNTLVRFKLILEPAPIDLWAKVVLSIPDGGGHLNEVQLFALDGPAKLAWNRLYSSTAGERAKSVA